MRAILYVTSFTNAVETVDLMLCRHSWMSGCVTVDISVLHTLNQTEPMEESTQFTSSVLLLGLGVFGDCKEGSEVIKG